MYIAPAKAHSQTAKRRLRGCFKKQHSQIGYTCPAGFGLQATSCMPSSKASAADQSLRYFQQYRLGSISVITDQAGIFLGAVASGGSCGSGVASAVFGKWATNTIGGTAGKFDAYQFAATAVAGGVGSVIGGGKFENGAMTAAYGYLFNCLATTTCRNLPARAGGSLELVGSAGSEYAGRDSTLAALYAVDQAWWGAGETAKIEVTEISRDPGATPGHESHQDGQHVDVRPIRTGGSGPLTYRSDTYDRAATQRLVDTILRVSPSATILFNDSQIRGVTPYKGHDNHLHIKFP